MGGKSPLLRSVYTPILIPFDPKLGDSPSESDRPSVGISNFASKSPSSEADILASISFLMKDANDLIVGRLVGNRASYRSEARKLDAAKSTEGDRARENCISGRYFLTSNTSYVEGSIGMPETEKELNLSNAPLSLRLLFRESRSLTDRSGSKFGSKSLSKVKDNAFGSEKDGAYPNATAICGRNSSTVK